MNILFVESKDDKVVLVTDKLGSNDCKVTRVKGVIEAVGLVGLRVFDLVLISDLSSFTPVAALVQCLRDKATPYVYLVPQQTAATVATKYPRVTMDELDNEMLDNLIHAGV